MLAGWEKSIAREMSSGRDVAIKVLPPAFALEPERVRRFEREARVLAALNYPHLAAIHGFEESDHVRGLVLELVEGPTLADRLTSGPLSVPEALNIARQRRVEFRSKHEPHVLESPIAVEIVLPPAI